MLVAGETRQDLPLVLNVDPDDLSRGEVLVAPDGTGRRLVSAGPVAAPNFCRIVDPETQTRCPEGRVGEIWVAGPAVALGYFQKPDQTAQCFGLSATDEDGAFLRTGDLGFMHNGRLYVTGRNASRILRFGQTFDAADLETAGAGAHSGLRAGRIAVLQTGEQEQIVVLQELSPAASDKASAAARALWSRILRQTGVAADRVCLLAPGALLWTTSGKIRRSASLAKLDNAPERLVFTWAPAKSDQAVFDLTDCLQDPRKSANQIEAKLCEWLAAVTGSPVEDVDPELSWSDQAVDSLKAAEPVEALESCMKRPLEADLLFTFPSPSDLAIHLASELS